MVTSIVLHHSNYEIYVNYNILFLYSYHHCAHLLPFFAIAVAIAVVAVIGDNDGDGCAAVIIY